MNFPYRNPFLWEVNWTWHSYKRGTRTVQSAGFREAEPFEFFVRCTLTMLHALTVWRALCRFRRCVRHCRAAAFPKQLRELDRRPPHRQRPRQRPGLRVQRHSGRQGPRRPRFRQPEGAVHGLRVDAARALGQEEGDDPVQFGQNGSVSPARRGTSVSTGVAAGGGHLVPPVEAPAGRPVYAHCPAWSPGVCSVFKVTAQVFGHLFVLLSGLDHASRWKPRCIVSKPGLGPAGDFVQADKTSSKSIKEVAAVSPSGLRPAAQQLAFSLQTRTGTTTHSSSTAAGSFSCSAKSPRGTRNTNPQNSTGSWIRWVTGRISARRLFRERTRHGGLAQDCFRGVFLWFYGFYVCG